MHLYLVRLKEVVGDFAKGLAAHIAQRKIRNAEGLNEVYILQLCEWHGVEATKRHLGRAGKYTKERRDEIADLIWS